MSFRIAIAGLSPSFCGVVSLVLVLAGSPVCVLGRSVEQQPVWLNVHAVDYVTLGTTPLDLEEGKILVGDGPWSTVDLTATLKYARYCALGTVADVRYDCVYREHAGAQSIAVVEFVVDELYWGAEADYVVFETLVSRVECPIVYDSPKYSEFEVGDRFLVVGSCVRPVNWARDLGLLQIEAGEVRAINGQVWSLAEVKRIVGELAGTRHRPKATGRTTFKLQR